MNPENEFAVGWVGRLDAECDKWKARAKLAEAKVRAVEAECDRLARNRGGWDSDIAALFRGVLASTDEDGQ